MTSTSVAGTRLGRMNGRAAEKPRSRDESAGRRVSMSSRSSTRAATDSWGSSRGSSASSRPTARSSSARRAQPDAGREVGLDAAGRPRVEATVDPVGKTTPHVVARHDASPSSSMPTSRCRSASRARESRLFTVPSGIPSAAGHLLAGEALHLAQHQHGALVEAQLKQRGLDPCPHARGCAPARRGWRATGRGRRVTGAAKRSSSSSSLSRPCRCQKRRRLWHWFTTIL